jgi:2-polyprenyl-6-methoxyphenol hydroxylase-like FAD-dependent oxidoreductase
MLFASRPLVEVTVRRRVAALPNVDLVPGCRVAGLATTEDGARVTGVQVIRPGEDVPATVEADMVVDASGRTSQSPAWLTALGYQAPEEEQVRVGLGYATRLYRRRPGDLGGDLTMVIGPTAGLRRMGVMCANEDDRWTVSVGGYAGHHPPTDPAGWEAFAATLALPDLAEAIAQLEPLGDPEPYRFPSSLRRRYERLRRFPDGYLVTGDALCSFNPIFGQGMTAAALEAEELAACLERPGPDLARRFFARAAAVIDVPWQVAVGADLRYPEVDGRRTAQVRIANAYTRHVSRAASVDAAVATAFMRVVSMFDRPEHLLRPAMAARVLAGTVRARRHAVPSAVPATPMPATAAPATTRAATRPFRRPAAG